MAITPARERVRKSRERKRRGVIPVQVEVSTLSVAPSVLYAAVKRACPLRCDARSAHSRQLLRAAVRPGTGPGVTHRARRRTAIQLQSPHASMGRVLDRKYPLTSHILIDNHPLYRFPLPFHFAILPLRRSDNHRLPTKRRLLPVQQLLKINLSHARSPIFLPKEVCASAFS
jgi:hypothetical protein